MTRTTEKYRIRNYKAMLDDKLMRSLGELEWGVANGQPRMQSERDAYYRCLSRGSGVPSYDLELCRQIALERRLIQAGEK